MLQHLVRTGPVLYAWDGSVPSNGVIDCKSIDPAKKASDPSTGKAAIGVRVGVTGDLLCTVQRGMGSTNVLFKSVAVNEFLAARILKILQTGSVVDAAAARTAVTVTFTGAPGPTDAAAVVTAINNAIHSAESSVPASGTGAVASLDSSSKYLVLTPPAGDNSMIITGGTGLQLLLGNVAQNILASSKESIQGIPFPAKGTVDLTVAANLSALAGKTLTLSVNPLITATSTAYDLAIFWEI